MTVSNAPSLPWPLLRLAFRPLFWFGALFSAIAMLLWVAHYSYGMPFAPHGGSYFWHMHEMLFGFVAAIISGFLLTAVQSWTQKPSVKGWPLALLVAVWLAGRLLMLIPGDVPASVIAAVDIAFLPMAAGFFARPIIAAKMWRNGLFIPVLLAMAALNGAMHYAIAKPGQVDFLAAANSVILLVALVMTIIGGRVFPMFTANGTRTPRVPALPWLERCAVFSVLLAAVLSLFATAVPAYLQAAVLLLAGVANLLRALRWRFWVTVRTPLVWSLHVSYWALAVGLLLMGLHHAGLFSSLSAAHHTITVGGMGAMILSMISRVSLGHTGRPLLSSPFITTSFVLIIIAFVLRLAAVFPLFASPHIMALAALMWALAYGIFVLCYAPVLFKPRADGGPG